MKDYYGKDAGELKNKKLFLLDMDGTIYNENTVFEGTHRLLEQIAENRGMYVFVTNNSSKSVMDYVIKLERMGIPADLDNFLTSSQAAAWLMKQKHPGALIYCQGTRSFVDELEGDGIRVTELPEHTAEAILVGFDTEVTGEKLRNTSRMLTTTKAAYYATNCDWCCPVDFGFIPDCGSMCEALEHATGRSPVFIGKPQPTMVELAMEKFGAGKEETVIIGDRLYTDIATGINAGITSICVLTGEAKEEDIRISEFKPTYVFDNIGTVAEAIVR